MDNIWNLTAAVFVPPIVSIILAIGFIKGMKWSWFYGVAIYAIGLFFAVANIAPLGILIYAIMVYYMSRAEVRHWFKVKFPERHKKTRR